MPSMPKLSLHEIHLTHQRIAPYVIRTPLDRSASISAQVGFDVYLKLENRQHTGSFKPRGALNKIMSLSSEELSHGIVAASAGNHALGVAYACKVLGIDNADVYVQANAAQAKIDKLRQYPINLHLIGRNFEEAQQAAREQADRSGSTFVSAYDDIDVIAGQATVGLEIMQDLSDVDTIVVPTGGGALVAGIANVAKSINPLVRIIGVNPAASPSALLSKQQGQPIDPFEHEPTLAQGLAGGFGRVPFMVGMLLIDEIVLVTEDEMKHAIAAMIDAEQILLEASGAVGIAAVLSGKIKNAKKCVVVLSGGNIDSGTLKQVLDAV
jgi:threonine dehydratase